MARNEKAKATIYLDGKQAEAALDSIKKKASELRKQLKEAQASGDVVKAKKIERELKGVEAAQRSLRKETFDYKKVLDDLSGSSLPDLTRAERKLNAMLRSPAVKRGTKEWEQYKQELRKVRAEKKRVNKELYATSSGGGPLAKLKNAAAGLLPAFGFAAIIGGVVAMGKRLFTLADQTLKYRQQVQQLTGETGQALAELTSKIDASAKTFQKDFNELAVANHNFAESMGISEQQANSLINKGFLAGADASGEFIDRLREYGPQFKAAGISAEQAIAIMTQEVQSGIYSDKGTDAIKEATIAIRKMTPVTREAIEGIGLSSAKLEADLRSGAISYFDAIQMISNKMAELPPQSTEVGTALADIFKGAGEDAGLDYITMLGNVEGSMDKLVNGAGETAQAQQKLLEANKKLSNAWSELLGTGTGTFTAIKATAKVLLADGIMGVINGIKGIRDWFIELYNESAVLRGYLQYVFAGWKTAITLVKTALSSLWENLKLGGKLMKAILTFDLSGVKQAFQDFADNQKENIVNSAQKVGNIWTDAYNNTVKGRIKPVKQKIEVDTNNQQTTTNQTTTTETTNQTTTTETTNQSGGGQESRTPIEMVEAESIGDPRINVEESYTETVLEQSKLRQRALDKEQEANEKRAKQEEYYQEQKRAAYLSTLDTMINVFGQESAIGKAALVAKQAFAIAETVINIAKGTGQTAAAAPFPANIPLIAGFVAQVAGLIGTIKGATKKVKAMAKGKYPVEADDGKTYNAQFAGRPKTGFYDGPQLGIFNEVPGQQEMVIDGITTRKIELNYPEIRDAIYAVRDGRMPAFSRGKYPGGHSAQNDIPGTAGTNPPQPYTSSGIDQNTAVRLAKALEDFTKKKLVVYSELIKKDIEQLEEIEKNR